MSALDHLYAQLAAAERGLFCADRIDNTARRDREVAVCERRVADLKRQIDEAEAEALQNLDPVNLAGSGPVPIEER